MNKDPRYKRYAEDAKFHHAVKVLYALITEHNFTHQDLQDACFCAYMRFLELNPVPLSIIPMPEELKNEKRK